MTTLTSYPASPKQVAFAADLLKTREFDTTDVFIEFAIDELAADALSKSDASKLIDMLINAPKRKGARSASQELLASVPKSKYAVPTEMLIGVTTSDVFHGDLVFLEIKEYMSSLYMRQLHGAPGAFNRSKLSQDSVKAIIAIIAEDPYKYTRIFGEHYTCCGSCGAELTDPKSRELMLGPECRKKFGH
jgi:hypothetical protein